MDTEKKVWPRKIILNAKWARFSNFTLKIEAVFQNRTKVRISLKTEISVYDLKKMEEWILKDETFPLYIEAVQNTLEDLLKS